VLLLRGKEAGPISLEDYANFLRDLVFLHDRLWILTANDERFYRLYYSNWFYVRDRQRVPSGEELQLLSARIGSPFEIKIDFNLGKIFEGAGKALVEILRGVATLPEYMERERIRTEHLRNRLLPVSTKEAETSQQQDQRLVRLASELRSLPGVEGEDGSDRMRYIQNEVDRISDSRLRITSVEIVVEKQQER
jgi:hypothetical protein